jgi:thiol-disulfide isomerase/thioredoxin
MEKPVVYLDGSDLDPVTRRLVIPNARDKPVLVFLHSDGCGACRAAKGAYVDFARLYSDRAVAAAVDADDARGSEFLSKLGFVVTHYPDYLKFVSGRLVRDKPLGRDVQSLIRFAFNKNVNK